MSKDSVRTIAFLCPKCGQPVVAERDEFSLCAADTTTIPCPCGKSELVIQPLLREFQLTVPCGSCGQTHRAAVPQEALLHQKAIALSCPATGLDSCYVGEEGTVYQAMTRLEETMDKVRAQKQTKSQEEEAEETDASIEQAAFLDPLVMEEVVGEIRDIAARNGISCTCGSKKWSIKIHYANVELICGDCGGTLRIPAATQNDIGDICCKQTLLIDRKE